jgi:hypothetical protein
MDKTCIKCGETKGPDDFYRMRNWCKECVKEYNRTYHVKRMKDPRQRREFLEYQKTYQASWGRQHRNERFKWLDEAKAKPCMDCHLSFPPECMDFDHRDPKTKLFNISQAAVSGRSVASVRAEMAKCDLVCANCHRIRTAKQQGRRGR